MLYKRVIAKLDIKSENVVKGIHMEGLRIIGEPGEICERYNRQGADEIVFIDTVASLYGRNHLKEFIAQASEVSYIPFTVGGGVRSLENIRSLINSGADKVAINTYAIENPGFITEAAEQFGAQAIVISVHAKKIGDDWIAFKENGRENAGKRVLDWVVEAAEAGAGELLVTSIDKDGTRKGFDTELYRLICERVSIPVIACGGAGNEGHIVDVMKNVDVSGVALGSVLHYNLSPIAQIKDSLKDGGVAVRPNLEKEFI